MYTNVTIPVDTEQPDLAAIEIASGFADRFGVDVELVTVASGRTKERKEAELTALASVPVAKTTTRVLVANDVSGELVGDVLHHPNCLWCVPTRARWAVVEALLGSVSDDLTRDSGRPLVLIGPRADRRVHDGGVVLVTVDETSASKAILPDAIALAHSLRLGVRIVEVIDSAKVPKGLRPVDSNDVRRVAAEWSTDGPPIDFDVLHGPHPAKAIVDYINRSPEIVLTAMASHGIPAHTRLVVPSTTYRVVRKAACPIVVLHPLPAYPHSAGGLVVAGVDELTASAGVVDFAVAEANKRGAKLLLVHTWEEQYYVGDLRTVYIETGPIDGHDAHFARMDEVVARAKSIAPDLQVDSVVSRGWAADVLIDFSRDAELIVVGHHEHHGLSAKAFGSTGRSVMKRAWCPVIVVPCPEHPEVTPQTTAFAEGIRNVVVATDGSEYADVAMAWAYDTCATWGASLTVMHVWEYPYSAMRASALPVLDYIRQDAAEALAGAVDRLRARKGDDVIVRSVLVEGPTRDSLRKAGADADLLVLGSHSRSVLGRLVLGSVTASIVEHPACPVAVVRTPFAKNGK
jgi:nucleotide-binding universal stress UspA family protein